MKRLLSLLALLMAGMAVWAQQLSEQQARVRVLQYLNQSARAFTRGRTLVQDNLKGARLDAKSIYAFNIEGGGFVITSGDSRALPVLGYADSGTIDGERLPENMRVWLKGYDDAIATLDGLEGFEDGHRQGASAATRAARTAIKPLLKTTWDQGEPFWDDIPLYDGADKSLKGYHCPVGCTAVMMAQVMNYYQWPKTACAEIPAYDLVTTHEKVEKTWHFDKLPPVTFDWANMINTYFLYDEEWYSWRALGTAAEKKAVATLMRYCGQSAEMVYHPEGSGAWESDAAEALVKYFGYDPSLRCVSRTACGIDEWEDLVYSELAAGHPVPYIGRTDENGHAFVCDGCDANGLFHINWGWNGINDGYFSLSVLNPENNSSYGASSSKLGYCLNQIILIGVKPAAEMVPRTTASPTAYIFADDAISILQPDSVKFTYFFQSNSYEDVKVDYALGTCDANGRLTPLYGGDKSDSIAYADEYNYHLVKIDSAAMSPGDRLTLYPMVKFRSIQGSDWQTLGSREFCVHTGCSEQGRFYLYRQIPDVEITDMEITKGSGRIGEVSNFTFTIKNKSDLDNTMNLPIIPYYYGDVDAGKITADTPFTAGDIIWSGTYLRAGEETKVTYFFKPQQSGTVSFKLVMPDKTPLSDYTYKVSNVVGCYDDYVNNESSFTMTEAYTDDYQTVAYSGNNGYRPGKGVYYVSFADNPQQKVPKGQPSNDIAVIGNLYSATGEDIVLMASYEDAYNYLKNLPRKAGKGNYKLRYELPFDIRRGGLYAFNSLFIEWLDDDNYIVSSEQYNEVYFFEDPCIRISGDTVVASGQRLNLEIHLSSGFPYEPADFTGMEEVKYTLYDMTDDGQLSERRSERMKLSFAAGNPLVATVDTIRVTSALPDGKYLLRISNDLTTLGQRDIYITVGASTGIGSVGCERGGDTYVDLQGRRLKARPQRKGVFLRNGRKEIVR